MIKEMFTGFKKIVKEEWRNWLVIELVALLFIMPQLLSRSMIVGSDINFHFNRFYDVAQQIENQHFQYFISQYGFQQSGRIVNAIYGPLIAYFHGFLVWLSSSWFVYQILSNVMLFALAGHCMYVLLKRFAVSREKALYLSLIYMTSFSILYWVTRQGFTSWGAAVLPLCLLPMIDLFENRRFNSVQVGFFMAFIFQIHLFSAVLLAIIYVICYCSVFIVAKEERKKMVVQGLLAILLFFLLTTNVWYGLLTLYQGNEILSPFVNRKIYENTTTFNSVYWLVTPGVLLVFMTHYFWKCCKEWKVLSFFDQVLAGIGAFFFILSTNVIPWRFLSERNWKVIETIQFPFRFFVPFTLLLLVFIGRNGQLKLKGRDQTTFLLKIAVVIAVLQTLLTITYFTVFWQTANQPVQSSLHTHLYTEEMEELKASFFNQDKSETLSLIQKSTPDYLPIYETNRLNKYNQYKVLVIDQNESGIFRKSVDNGSLIITWEGELGEEVFVPVIVYNRTKVVFNEVEMPHEDLKLTDIGTPNLISKEGENRLVISYESSQGLLFSLAIPLLTSACLFLYLRIKR